MIEVEIKAKIKDLNEVKSQLNALNIKQCKEENQEDLYFQSPIVDFIKTDEALRIRKIMENDKKEVFITYKGPKISNESKTREEIEINIEDSEKGKKIFEKIGFKTVRTVKKKRCYYKYKKFIISLDFVEGLDPYMEIETILEENTNYENIQNEIFEIFKKLKIEDGFERNSYLELLENK